MSTIEARTAQNVHSPLAALLRERRPEFCGQQRVRDEEQNGQEDQPGERLWPVAGDRSERVDPDKRADQEKHDASGS
jgi:hypothetical protein